MQIDLSPLVRVLAPLLLAALTAAVPYGAVLARRALGLRLTAQQQRTLSAAVDAGAQAAYGYLATNQGTIFDLPMRSRALATGVNHALACVGPTLKTLNITPDHIRAMVNARLGGLLAADPAVSVVSPQPNVQTPMTSETEAGRMRVAATAETPVPPDPAFGPAHAPAGSAGTL
jgi:hypothetical protein